MGLGFFLSGFFTLDCREIDAGCENSSWQASAHVGVAAPALLALAIAPFVLSRALRFAPRWSDLRKRTLAFGVGTIVAFVVGSAVGVGLGQYLTVIVWFTWIGVLVIRMLQLARGEATASETSPAAS